MPRCHDFRVVFYKKEWHELLQSPETEWRGDLVIYVDVFRRLLAMLAMLANPSSVSHAGFCKFVAGENFSMASAKARQRAREKDIENQATGLRSALCDPKTLALKRKKAL